MDKELRYNGKIIPIKTCDYQNTEGLQPTMFITREPDKASEDISPMINNPTNKALSVTVTLENHNILVIESTGNWEINSYQILASNIEPIESFQIVGSFLAKVLKPSN